MIVATDDAPLLVKLRGAAQGTAALVAEVVVATLAERLALPVPSRRVVTLSPDVPSDDRNDELADLLAASVGENLGFEYLEGTRQIDRSDVDGMDVDFASRVCWLDWLVQNSDRTLSNPNVLVRRGRYWLIDHGAALPFHHNWAAVTEEAPRREWPVGAHVLAARATRLAEWDPLLTETITREAVAAATASIPDSFLRPLLPPDAAANHLTRRRAAYEAFLWKRLRAPRPWARLLLESN